MVGAAMAASMMAGAAQAACVGSCGTDGADGVVTLSPTGNSSYQWISTNGGQTGVGEIASQASISTNGSTLTSSVFTAAANDPLTLYFNFVTSDGSGFPDYAFAELQTSGGSHVAWLFTAATQPSGNTSPGQGLPTDDSTLTPPTSGIIAGGPTWSPLGQWSGQCFAAGCGYTGWIQSTYDIALAGDYQVVFGVSNTHDEIYDTGLAFDGLADNGVTIPTGPPGVPEPATWALMLAGVGLLGGALRTTRRAASLVAA